MFEDVVNVDDVANTTLMRRAALRRAYVMSWLVSPTSPLEASLSPGVTIVHDDGCSSSVVELSSITAFIPEDGSTVGGAAVRCDTLRGDFTLICHTDSDSLADPRLRTSKVTGRSWAPGLLAMSTRVIGPFSIQTSGVDS